MKRKNPLNAPNDRRRRTLVMLGGALLGTAAQTRSAPIVAMPACVVTPGQTEGPFFVDSRLNRSDIRIDPATGKISEGVPLVLTLRVSAVGRASCTPMSGVMVDVWHCDANGHYSGVGGRRGGAVNDGFLRGYQLTGADGAVTFRSVYPGWYPGRAVHIHFKVRVAPNGNRAAEFVSQLYFDEGVTDVVHATGIYAVRGRREVMNKNDGLFLHDEGLRLLIRPEKTADGYVANFDIGIEA